VLDPAKLEANLEGDAEMMRQVIDTYLRDQPQREREMTEALAKGDAPTLARAAHTVKGLMLTLGAGSAAEIALRLEILARCGNLVEAEDVLGELRGELALIPSALREALHRRAA
jgi:HPt (histidine-containing phosphotransfer) domain-containing protein